MVYLVYVFLTLKMEIVEIKFLDSTFDSIEGCIKYVHDNDIIGILQYTKTTFESKKKDVITRLQLGLIDCSTIQLIKLIKLKVSPI